MEHSRMPRGQNGCRQLGRHPHDMRSCCRRIPGRLLPGSACFRFRRRTQPSTARGRRPPCSTAWISLAPAHLPLPSRPPAIRKPSPCSPPPPAAMMAVHTLLYRVPFRLISGLERTAATGRSPRTDETFGATTPTTTAVPGSFRVPRGGGLRSQPSQGPYAVRTGMGPRINSGEIMRNDPCE